METTILRSIMATAEMVDCCGVAVSSPRYINVVVYREVKYGSPMLTRGVTDVTDYTGLRRLNCRFSNQQEKI